MVARGEQVRHDLEPLVAPVDTADELEVVAVELRLVPAEGDDLTVAVDGYDGDRVPELIGELDDVVPEAGPQAPLHVRR
jgi:hypothetical protein